MIIADTHSWIWWISSPSRLSVRARRALESEPEIGVSAISCWELAMLVTKRRLGLDRDVLVWIKQSLARPRVNLLPLSPEVAVAAASLVGEFDGDPADRIIAATALRHRAQLVTKDRRMRNYKKLRTVW